MRFHSSVNTGLVGVLERSLGRGGSRRCTVEDVFQIVIMVAVEPADGQNFLGALQLASDEAVFSAGVRSQRQTTVGPQLPLGPEAMGGCIRAINRTARMGPIEGICRSNLMAGCFRPSAKSSRRAPWRNIAKASNF